MWGGVISSSGDYNHTTIKVDAVINEISPSQSGTSVTRLRTGLAFSLPFSN